MSERQTYTRAQILDAAQGWIGTPYRHQACCKGAGVDCLGLVRGIFQELEGREPETPPAYSPDWAELPGVIGNESEPMLSAARRHLVERPVGTSVKEATAGDVLIFRMSPNAAAKHAAIMSDGGRMIHAYSGRAVAENHIGPWWERRLVAIFQFPGVSD
ncbi:MAG: NlpC/P60 family protein [Parvibaculum sp.]